MLSLKNTYIPTIASMLLVLTAAAAPQAGNMGTRSAQTTLVLDGVDAGHVVAFEKGACYAEVVSTNSGNGSVLTVKRPGRVRMEPLQLTIGLTNPMPVYEWVRQSWAGQSARKSGQLLIGDATRLTAFSRQFSNALVAETTIPAMDRTSREEVWLNVKVAPETISFIKGGVDPKVSPAVKKGSVVKSDFAFEITGIDCSHVASVDELSVKQELLEYTDGDGAQTRLRPGRLAFPNIKLTVAEAGAQPFIDWHEQFVVRGNNSSAQHKQGKMTLWSKVGGTRLVITMKNLGIVRVCPAKQGIGDSAARRLEVEMYVESMDLVVEAMPPAAAPRSMAAVND